MQWFSTRISLLVPIILLSTPAFAGPWFVCGNLPQLSGNCQLQGYPSTHYKYGIGYYNTSGQVLEVLCVSWNYGFRVHNKLPYFIESDNPQSGVRWGGFMFYTNTLANDDDTCPAGSWRHKYWRLDQDNKVIPLGSNGCNGAELSIWCRAR